MSNALKNPIQEAEFALQKRLRKGNPIGLYDCLVPSIRGNRSMYTNMTAAQGLDDFQEQVEAADLALQNMSLENSNLRKINRELKAKIRSLESQIKVVNEYV